MHETQITPLEETEEFIYEKVPIYRGWSNITNYQAGSSNLISRENLMDSLCCYVLEADFENENIQNIRGEIFGGSPDYLIYNIEDQQYWGISLLKKTRKERLVYNYAAEKIDSLREIATECNREDLLSDIDQYDNLRGPTRMDYFFRCWDGHPVMDEDEDFRIYSDIWDSIKNN